jgi:hypothetical protein
MLPREAPAPAARSAMTQRIQTPDRRVRVFVSPTLQELAEERSAARSAIQHLRLTPVMFELGARAHPPRDLYRAYLAQSDVFLGIYWQRYGWVAPGESLSGLEDEYGLAGDKPKLIYIKSADSRGGAIQEIRRHIRDGALSKRASTTPVPRPVAEWASS